MNPDRRLLDRVSEAVSRVAPSVLQKRNFSIIPLIFPHFITFVIKGVFIDGGLHPPAGPFSHVCTEGDLEQLRERLGLDRLKANALEEGRFNAKPTALERFRGRVGELDQAVRAKIERLRHVIVARHPGLGQKPRLTMGVE